LRLEDNARVTACKIPASAKLCFALVSSAVIVGCYKNGAKTIKENECKAWKREK
jgi:hypothetical protein